MQQTRRLILEYMKRNGQATVDELAATLSLTAVTVRHHLDILRGEELVAEPTARHRTTRGRPQHVYTLTEAAAAHFPKNYDDLAAKVIDEVRAQAGPQFISLVLDSVADRMAAEAPAADPTEALDVRLDRAVEFLNQRGYVARWERSAEGYVLHTCNCPYESLSVQYGELCAMDQSLISRLVGVDTERLSRVADGDRSCAYLVRPN